MIETSNRQPRNPSRLLICIRHVRSTRSTDAVESLFRREAIEPHDRREKNRRPADATSAMCRNAAPCPRFFVKRSCKGEKHLNGLRCLPVRYRKVPVVDPCRITGGRFLFQAELP